MDSMKAQLSPKTSLPCLGDIIGSIQYSEVGKITLPLMGRSSLSPHLCPPLPMKSTMWIFRASITALTPDTYALCVCVCVCVYVCMQILHLELSSGNIHPRQSKGPPRPSGNAEEVVSTLVQWLKEGARSDQLDHFASHQPHPLPVLATAHKTCMITRRA